MTERTDIVKREETIPEQKRQLHTIAPVVDIYENDDEILVYADMPGVDKQDVAINVDNGKLDLRGVREMSPSGVLAWGEFADVEYRRSFSVPQTIDIAKVHAELKEGVLRLHLPKSAAARPRQIEIH